jgi:hypothetical protein
VQKFKKAENLTMNTEARKVQPGKANCLPEATQLVQDTAKAPYIRLEGVGLRGAYLGRHVVLQFGTQQRQRGQQRVSRQAAGVLVEK